MKLCPLLVSLPAAPLCPPKLPSGPRTLAGVGRTVLPEGNFHAGLNEVKTSVLAKAAEPCGKGRTEPGIPVSTRISQTGLGVSAESQARDKLRLRLCPHCTVSPAVHAQPES